ncbi:Uncharacterized protein SAMN05660835_00077 [Desulfurella multipotens]|uniref:DUF2250 domain-containing protein n=1 Tax=Desulfurella multipotens TaxID=79269 RepID=A0A1G6HQR0_9BACT|nr:DUF2250 domain-containing protein [Desulfurella multipotens]SDB96580.1 Uncharacterized protein SAMN05660835_00077 [Desulfurella multipotens]
MCDLNNLEIEVLKYHKQKGCDYSKSLAKALNIKLCEAFKVHKKLLELGYLEKVKSRFTKYKIDNKTKLIKHRNHTYYQLSHNGKQFLKELIS